MRKNSYVINLLVAIVLVFSISSINVNAENIQNPDNQYEYLDYEFKKFSIGYSHAAMLTNKGELYTWGKNFSGQLGDGTTNNSIIPINITNNFNLNNQEYIVYLESGYYRNYVLTNEGRIFAWGYNEYGQIGVGTYDNVLLPMDITSFFDFDDNETVSKISVDGYSTILLTSHNRVFSWGSNVKSKIGNGTATDSAIPIDITSFFELDNDDFITDVASSTQHALALSNKGAIFQWGDIYDPESTESNYNARIIQSTPLNISNYFNLTNDDRIIEISAANYTSFALTKEGELFSWGHNSEGQLGTGDQIQRNIPTNVTDNISLENMEKITKIVSGSAATGVTTSNNRVFLFGQQIEDLYQPTITPIEVENDFLNDEDEINLAFSGNNTGNTVIVFYTDTQAFMMGRNEYEIVIGLNKYEYTSEPLEITWDFNSILIDNSVIFGSPSQISASGHILLLTEDFRLYSWGSNRFGQLGSGDTYDYEYPREITNIFQIDSSDYLVEVFASSEISMVLTNSGRVFTWGYGGYAQLGNNSLENSLIPIEITEYFSLTQGEKIVSISGNSSISLATSNYGRIFTWGYNTSGLLGNDYTNIHFMQKTPLDITSNFDESYSGNIAQIAIGRDHVTVLTSENEIYSWGSNAYGQLGDGTTDSTLSPQKIDLGISLLPNETIDKISNGYCHTLILTSMNRLYAHGCNFQGEIAKDPESTSYESTPIEITSNFVLFEGESISDIFAYNFASMVLTSDGRIFTFGQGSSGKLGTGNEDDTFLPMDVTSNIPNYTENSIKYIQASFNPYIVLSDDTIVRFIGSEENGFLPKVVTSKVSDVKILNLEANRESNYHLENIKLSIYPSINIFPYIETIKVNNIFYNKEKLIYNDGVITLDVNNDGIVGEEFEIVIESITFIDGTLINIYEQNTTSTFLVEDIWPPEFIFNKSQDFIIEADLGDESYLTAQAKDDTGEVLEYTITGDVNWNIPGTYTLTYTSVDLSGNITEINREITVMPSVTTEGQQYQDYKFYYLLDDIVSEDLDLSNLVIRYNNQNYSPITDPNDIKYLEGKNVIPFVFDIEGTTIIVGKDVYLEGNDDIPPTFDFIDYQTIEMGVNDIDWTTYITNASDNIPYGRLTKVEFRDQVDYQNLGTYSVTVKLIDAFGNETAQTFEVTVQDTTAPTFDFIPNQTIESGQDNFDWTTFMKNIEDNSFQDVIVEEAVDTVDYNTPGEYSVTVSVTDVYGNVKEQTFKVYVQDTTAPTVNMETSYTIEAANQDIDWTGEIISFSDNSDGPIYAEELVDNVDYDSPGTYIITILVYDASGNETTQEIEVNIVDTTAPSINGVSDYEYVLGTNLLDYLAGITATDIVDGELTNVVTVDDSAVLYDQVGKYPVIYQVTDSNGNIVEETIEVFVRELVPPVITLSGDERETVELGEEYVQVGGTCTDNYDDVCTVTMQGVVDTSQVGEYTTVYTATDESENTTTITRTVNVVDTTAPELSLNPMDSTVPINAILEETGVTILDLSDTTMTIDSNLDLTTVGTYTITYTVIDNSGNSSVIERIIHVYEPEPEVHFHLEDALTTIEVGSTYEDTGCIVIINGESFNCSIEENTVDTAIAGVYKVTYSVDYQGTTYTYDRYIFVYDVDENGQQTLYYRKEQEEGVFL